MNKTWKELFEELIDDPKVLSIEVTGWDRGGDTETGNPQPIFKVTKTSQADMATAAKIRMSF